MKLAVPMLNDLGISAALAQPLPAGLLGRERAYRLEGDHTAAGQIARGAGDRDGKARLREFPAAGTGQSSVRFPGGEAIVAARVRT